MRSIYESAERVIAWLSSATSTIDLAMEFTVKYEHQISAEDAEFVREGAFRTEFVAATHLGRSRSGCCCEYHSYVLIEMYTLGHHYFVRIVPQRLQPG